MSDKIREALMTFLALGIDENKAAETWPEIASALTNARAALAQQPAPVAVTDQMVDAAILKAHGYQADHLCREFYRLVVEGAFAAAPAAPVAVGQEAIGTLVVFDDADSEFGHQYSISTTAAGHRRLSAMDGAQLYAAPPAAEQPDAVKVQRHTLARYADHLQTAGYNNAADDLRALLGKDGEA